MSNPHPTPKFKKGNKLAPGGPRPNAGRKTDAFKRFLRRLTDSPKVRKQLRDILENKTKVEKLFQSDGEVIRALTGVTVSDWLKALEYVTEYGHGKKIELTAGEDENGNPRRLGMELIHRTEGKHGEIRD